jgi:hypothetical protein
MEPRSQLLVPRESTSELSQTGGLRGGRRYGCGDAAELPHSRLVRDHLAMAEVS